MSDPQIHVEHYIAALRRELGSADPALAQDAAFDVREHLTAAFEERLAARPGVNLSVVFDEVVARFGNPTDVAQAYREAERRVGPAALPPRTAPRSAARRVFGVFTDPYVYGALFYLLLALPTGIVYFTWTVTGLGLTAGFSILIIGIPFALLFLASIRALSLIEGRVVEALLGVRMPRRPAAPGVPGSIWARFKYWFTDARTWSTLVYMLLRLPLGVAYFAGTITLLALSLSLMLVPFVRILTDWPVEWWGGGIIPVPAALAVGVGGFALLLGTLHLARAVGRFHGWLAKSMLVRSFAGPDGAAQPAAETAPAH